MARKLQLTFDPGCFSCGGDGFLPLLCVGSLKCRATPVAESFINAAPAAFPATHVTP